MKKKKFRLPNISSTWSLKSRKSQHACPNVRAVRRQRIQQKPCSHCAKDTSGIVETIVFGKLFCNRGENIIQYIPECHSSSYKISANALTL